MTTLTLPGYPKALRHEGGVDVVLRLMTAQDGHALLAFVSALSRHDLLFLRRDISRRSGVHAWLRAVDEGLESAIVAEQDARIVGFASVERSGLDWSRHVADVHAMTAPSVRGLGVGRELVFGAVRLALALGIEKLYARMTIDQMGARVLFERMGFRPEALLHSDVKDRAGEAHDVLVFSSDLLKNATALDRLLDAGTDVTGWRAEEAE